MRFIAAMVEYQTLPGLLFLSTTQTLIPAVLIATTPKKSPLRYLSIPCMIWVLKLMLYPVEKPSYLACNSAGGGLVGIIAALDVLLINPIHAGDFVDADGKTQNIFSRLRSAVELMTTPRMLNTPKEAKNTPPLPKYYTEKGSKIVKRGRFLIRETAIATWQYLFLDIMTLEAAKLAQRKKETEVLNTSEPPENLRMELWIEQGITALVAWFVVTRILIGFYYRLLSIFCVALGLESPERFPPLFNKMADAYTLRNFWGFVLT